MILHLPIFNLLGLVEVLWGNGFTMFASNHTDITWYSNDILCALHAIIKYPL